MSSRKRKQLSVVAAATVSSTASRRYTGAADRPAPRSAHADVLDDGGNLSFISLSKYGALEDDEEVSASVSQHIADVAEQRTRRKDEQRRRQQQDDEAVALKPATTPRHKRPTAQRPVSDKKQHKRVRQEAKEVEADDSEPQPQPQPIDDSEDDAKPITRNIRHPLLPTPSAPPPPPSSTAPILPPPLLSRFTVSPTKLIANSDGSYTVHLHAGECIVFYGSVDMRVEYGYVRCAHHILSPSSPHAPHQLHSPAWQPTALLTIAHHTPTQHRPSSSSAALHATNDESIITLSPSTSPHRLHSTTPDPATTLLPIALPAFYPLLQQSAASYGRQPLAALGVSVDWMNFLDTYSTVGKSKGPVSSFLLCGGRNGGKSTLSRLLVNGLLNVCRRVLYMDVDVGQSECTPPSLVSLSLLSTPLLSPPHCHQATPSGASAASASGQAAPQTLLAYHIGDVSFTSDPADYVECAMSLWQRADEERRVRKGELLPVVINTAGWIKGAGGVVLAELIDRIKPQHVVYLGDQHADDVPAVAASSTLHVLPRYTASPAVAGASANAALSADKSRTLALLSYFLQRSCPPVSFLTAASLLSALRPYRIPFAAVSLQLLPPNDRLPHSLYPQAFNATIVALCTADATHTSTSHTPTGLRIATTTTTDAAQSPLPCLGLAIVRAIDLPARHLYVLTPLPLEVLRRVRVLVRGSMELPSVLVYERESGGCGQPYMPQSALGAVSGGGSIAGRKSVARKRLAGAG